MNKTQQRTNGFTIIEILVVLVIIIILAGMVFKMMGHAGTKNEQAYTRSVLEKLGHALEEFRATYGKYPPVSYYPGVDPEQPSEYEYPVMGSSIAENLKNASESVNLWSPSGEGRIFTFGLVSFLIPRYSLVSEDVPEIFVGGKSGASYDPDSTINQWSDHNSRDKGKVGDLRLDLEASRRILPYLGVTLGSDNKFENGNQGIIKRDPQARFYHNLVYTNSYYHIDDGWNRQIRYQSRPPYETYKLWSVGPDGKNGTGDDIVLGKE